MDECFISFTCYKLVACNMAKKRCRALVVRGLWGNLGLAIALVHDKKAKAVEMLRSFDMCSLSVE